MSVRLIDGLVVAVLAVVGFLAVRAINQFDQGVIDASQSLRKIEALQTEVKNLSGQVEKIEVQLEGMKDLQTKIVITTGTREHRDRQIETMIRDMWQKK